MKKLSLLFILIFSIQSVFSQKPPKSDFVGNYKITGAPFEKMSVFVKDNALMAEAEGVGAGEINETEEANVFSEPVNGAKITFKRDENGKVYTVLISVQGMEFTGEMLADPLAEYAGKYKLNEGSPISQVIVVAEGGKLYGDSEQGRAELKPTSMIDEYEVLGFGGTAIFNRNDKLEIVGVKIMVQGMTMEGKK